MEQYKCEAEIAWPKGEKCQHEAKVEIDGEKLCMKHAGMRAIKKLYEMGILKKLESFNPHFYKNI